MPLNQLINGLMVAHALHNDHPVFSFGAFPLSLKTVSLILSVKSRVTETFFKFSFQQKRGGENLPFESRPAGFLLSALDILHSLPHYVYPLQPKSFTQVHGVPDAKCLRLPFFSCSLTDK